MFSASDEYSERTKEMRLNSRNSEHLPQRLFFRMCTGLVQGIGGAEAGGLLWCEIVNRGSRGPAETGYRDITDLRGGEC